MKKMTAFLKKLLLLLTGLSLAVIGGKALWHFFQEHSSSRLPLLLGLGCFCTALLICHFLWRMKTLYVLCHESAHWLAAKLLFKETGKFKVSGDSGSVEIKGSNMFTDLAPYVYPTACIVICIPWVITKLSWPEHPPELDLSFLGIVAYFYGHHHYMNTRLLIKTRQSDLTKHGYWPALTVVCGLNLILLLCFFAYCDHKLQQVPGLLKDNALTLYSFIISIF